MTSLSGIMCHIAAYLSGPCTVSRDSGPAGSWNSNYLSYIHKSMLLMKTTVQCMWGCHFFSGLPGNVSSILKISCQESIFVLKENYLSKLGFLWTYKVSWRQCPNISLVFMHPVTKYNILCIMSKELKVRRSRCLNLKASTWWNITIVIY